MGGEILTEPIARFASIPRDLLEKLGEPNAPDTGGIQHLDADPVRFTLGIAPEGTIDQRTRDVGGAT
ncbi:MAG: hypothetical protein AAF942_14095, partial [Pseudomonadota bacterium]